MVVFVPEVEQETPVLAWTKRGFDAEFRLIYKQPPAHWYDNMMVIIEKIQFTNGRKYAQCRRPGTDECMTILLDKLSIET